MPDSRPKNILFITADQMRWDCLGCVGNEIIKTPTLDAIARRGVLFRNGFSPDPICVPARATMMTGNYPQVCTGEKRNSGRIKDGQPLLSSVLQSVGYRTYAKGKLHFVPYQPPGKPRLVHGLENVELTESGRMIRQFDPTGATPGIEDYFDYLKEVGWCGYARAHGIGNNDIRPCASPLPKEHYVDHWIADRVIAEVDAHLAASADTPFFMWMSSPKPHSPYDPPRPFDNLYDPRLIPAPAGSPELLHGRYAGIDRVRHTHAAVDISPEAWRVIRSYYYGNITFLDEMIGRVLSHLEEKGVLDDTLILFTADHGDLLGDFGSVFKSNHLNGAVRVPFIVCGPGVEAGRVSDALVGLQDILPTFASFAGADVGADVHGVDLMPHLGDASADVRDVYYATTRGLGQTAMVTDGRFKYIYAEANATEELYDQIADPGELVNLAVDGGKEELRARMREMLIACAREFDDAELLDGDDLAKTEVDTSEFAKLPIGGMGWRWY